MDVFNNVSRREICNNLTQSSLVFAESKFRRRKKQEEKASQFPLRSGCDVENPERI